MSTGVFWNSTRFPRRFGLGYICVGDVSRRSDARAGYQMCWCKECWRTVVKWRLLVCVSPLESSIWGYAVATKYVHFASGSNCSNDTDARVWYRGFMNHSKDIWTCLKGTRLYGNIPSSCFGLAETLLDDAANSSELEWVSRYSDAAWAV
jgi:hypothetical protein